MMKEAASAKQQIQITAEEDGINAPPFHNSTDEVRLQEKLELSNACLHKVYHGTRNIPIVKRLYPALLKLWVRLAWPWGFKIKRYKGSLFLLHYRNYADHAIGLHGGFEGDRTEYFFSEMAQGCDVFVDVGASIGLYALQAAHCGVTKEIHAFEPDPRNYAQLISNIWINGYDGVVQAYPEALSSADGTLEFEMARDGQAISSQIKATALEPGPNIKRMGRLTPGKGILRMVQARRLDDILPHRGKRICMKITAQGHELDVLKGAAGLLRNNDCLLEVHIWPENVERVLKHLEEAGYKVSHRIRELYYYLTKA